MMFTGPIPALYDRYLTPMLFAPFARDIAARAHTLAPVDVLETACGTGIVTEAVRSALPSARIVATDLNPKMLEVARDRSSIRDVTFDVVDAHSLPYGDGTFDLLVTQFGVMFFPDRAAAFREARRVLRPRGTWLLNVWRTLADNPLSDVVNDVVKAAFHKSAPDFLERIPFGHADPLPIVAALNDAGFDDVAYETVRAEARAQSVEAAVTGIVCGTPLRGEIEARDPARLDEIVAESAREARRRFGDAATATPTAAIVYAARSQWHGS
ncbi:MAG: class I SAM-dependent methyltransferase [Candidatus Velthaea sp.]